jgi:hypothetical protein
MGSYLSLDMIARETFACMIGSNSVLPYSFRISSPRTNHSASNVESPFFTKKLRTSIELEYGMQKFSDE